MEQPSGSCGSRSVKGAESAADADGAESLTLSTCASVFQANAPWARPDGSTGFRMIVRPLHGDPTIITRRWCCSTNTPWPAEWPSVRSRSTNLLPDSALRHQPFSTYRWAGTVCGTPSPCATRTSRSLAFAPVTVLREKSVQNQDHGTESLYHYDGTTTLFYSQMKDRQVPVPFMSGVWRLAVYLLLVLAVTYLAYLLGGWVYSLSALSPTTNSGGHHPRATHTTLD